MSILKVHSLEIASPRESRFPDQSRASTRTTRQLTGHSNAGALHSIVWLTSRMNLFISPTTHVPSGWYSRPCILPTRDCPSALLLSTASPAFKGAARLQHREGRQVSNHHQGLSSILTPFPPISTGTQLHTSKERGGATSAKSMILGQAKHPDFTVANADLSRCCSVPARTRRPASPISGTQLLPSGFDSDVWRARLLATFASTSRTIDSVVEEWEAWKLEVARAP